MPTPNPDQEAITVLLREWQAGDRNALDQLVAAVHGELRRLAAFHLRDERRNHTLQPTALVNEVYLRLVGIQAMHWRDRSHFFAMVSRIMRRVLVDAARAHNADKRGAGVVRVSADEADSVEAPTGADTMPDMLSLDEALTALAELDERKASVVELRFFGGLSVEDTAGVLGVSEETVARDWRTAKIWLRREISRPPTP
jgi:RNA polymerase sigma-70 factor (ECF subfamily)